MPKSCLLRFAAKGRWLVSMASFMAKSFTRALSAEVSPKASRSRDTSSPRSEAVELQAQAISAMVGMGRSPQRKEPPTR